MAIFLLSTQEAVELYILYTEAIQHFVSIKTTAQLRK